MCFISLEKFQNVCTAIRETNSKYCPMGITSEAPFRSNDTPYTLDPLLGLPMLFASNPKSGKCHSVIIAHFNATKWLHSSITDKFWRIIATTSLHFLPLTTNRIYAHMELL